MRSWFYTGLLVVSNVMHCRSAAGSCWVHRNISARNHKCCMPRLKSSGWQQRLSTLMLSIAFRKKQPCTRLRALSADLKTLLSPASASVLLSKALTALTRMARISQERAPVEDAESAEFLFRDYASEGEASSCTVQTCRRLGEHSSQGSAPLHSMSSLLSSTPFCSGR